MTNAAKFQHVPNHKTMMDQIIFKLPFDTPVERTHALKRVREDMKDSDGLSSLHAELLLQNVPQELKIAVADIDRDSEDGNLDKDHAYELIELYHAWFCVESTMGLLYRHFSYGLWGGPTRHKQWKFK